MKTQSTGENRHQSNHTQNLTSFSAAVTSDEIQQMEIVAENSAINRRLMFLVLGRSSEELTESFMQTDDDRELLLKVVDSIAEFKQQLKYLSDLTDSALARLAFVSGVFAESTGNKKG